MRDQTLADGSPEFDGHRVSDESAEQLEADGFLLRNEGVGRREPLKDRPFAK
jgi:hypothetical protein